MKLTLKAPTLETILVMVGAAGSWATLTELRVGAVRLSVAAFVAASVTVPPFKETLVPIAIPSVSISELLVCTVYRKIKAVDPDPDR